MSASLYGIESRIISVEADVSDGLPQFSMVGYLSAEVREAQERVRTAIKNSGYRLLPKRITVNLAPADIRKAGTGFDLPIAAAVMSAYGYVPQDILDGLFLAGELSLDGSIHRIWGVLGMVRQARLAGCTVCIVPEENAEEAAVIQGISVFGASHLREVIAILPHRKGSYKGGGISPDCSAGRTGMPVPILQRSKASIWLSVPQRSLRPGCTICFSAVRRGREKR